MKCPACNQSPMSFVKYLFFFGLLDIHCRRCGEALTMGSLVRIISYSVFVFGVVAGIVFLQTFGVTAKLLVAIAAVLIVFLPVALAVWNYGVLKRTAAEEQT